MAATLWEVAGEHVLSFGAGVVLGFVLTNRYRIIRRNGGTDDRARQ